jgi:predicted CXXCH cytochrome family protein
MIVRIEIPKGRAVRVSSVDRDGNGFVTKPEWHAFTDLLRSDFKGAHDISASYRIEADVHTIGRKPAECLTCHSRDGLFRSAILEVTGGEGFKIKVDPTIFVPELPSREEFGRTVHGKNGVACSDCHKSQNRRTEAWSAAQSAVCANCHEGIYKTYRASIHSRNGATNCVDCHNPHRIKSYRELNAEERVAVCSKCHTDYLKKHSWLPNTTLHFGYLECATCHSPGSEKSIVFYLARKTDGRKLALSHSDILRLYGSDPVPAITSTPAYRSYAPASATGAKVDQSAESRIGSLFTALFERDSNLLVDASIVLTRVYHNFSETRIHEKKCVTCHSGEAAFYGSMFFALPAKDSTDYVPVRGTLLSSYPIGEFVDFFLLGERKIRKNDLYALFGKKTEQEAGYAPALKFKLIDLFGILLIVLVLLGILSHIVLKILVKR